MPLMPSRVLLVDDDPLHLEVFQEWLTASGCEVTTALSGEDALALLRPDAFEVAVLDLKMPGMNGLELLDRCKARDPFLEIVILTGAGTMDAAISALRHGRAFDFLLKPVPDLCLFNQVLAQAQEHRHKALASARSSPSLTAPSFIEPLTPREHEIVSRLLLGWSNARIAAELGLQSKTVRNILTRIYEKLKVTSRAEAMVVCQRYGLDALRA